MEYFEYEIDKYKRRVQKIRKNPDPTRLASNLLLYEMDLDYRIAELESCKSGRPFIWTNMATTALCRAMGFELFEPEQAADRLLGEAGKFFQILGANRLPEQSCDRTVLPLAQAIKGDIPLPRVVLTHNAVCDNVLFRNQTLAQMYNLPIFSIDVPFEVNEEAISYIAEQLAEFIRFAENHIPGISYDEEKHRELLAFDRAELKPLRGIYELKKRIPCPLAPRDAFKEERIISVLNNQQQGLEYYTALERELRERADKRTYTTKPEKARLMWLVTGPLFTPAPFDYLERNNVSIPIFVHGSTARLYGVRPVYQNRWLSDPEETPLKEQAKWIYASGWIVPAETWVEDCVALCQDLNIDGVVYFIQMGCTQTASMAQLVADTIEEKLGIPTLMLNGRSLDPSVWDEKAAEVFLETFIDMCVTRKESRLKQHESRSKLGDK